MRHLQEKVERNRGVALWGNLVVSVAGQDARVIATDKQTGKVVWDKNLHDQPDMTINAAPLALRDEIIVGPSNQGVSSAVFICANRSPDRVNTSMQSSNPGTIHPPISSFHTTRPVARISS